MKKILVVSCFSTVLLGLSQIVISSSKPAGEDEVEKLRAELKEKRAELQKWQDEYRRLQGETDRTTATMAQEFAALRQIANEFAKREQRALSILCEGLKDSQPPVRRWSAESLGNLRGDAKGAVDDLVRVLKDEDATVRKTAAEALKKIDPTAAAKAGIK